ncbi:MAG: hypothetical protein ACREFD_08605 [Stellaceae bacterium]
MDTTFVDCPVTVRSGETEDAALPDHLLRLLLLVLNEFNRQNLIYCYWKSRRRVHLTLSGDADLDLLIARADQHRARAILLGQGFKHFPDTANRSHPALSSYLGYDEPSGRIVHVHLHFRLVVGEALFRNYRLPWEATLLEGAEFHPVLPIRVLDAASEALLLAVRLSVEPSRMDPVAVRQRHEMMRKFQLDRAELALILDRMTLTARAREVFPADLAEMIADALLCGASLECRSPLWRRIRRELAEHRTYAGAEARLRASARGILWAAGNANRRVLHLPRPSSRRAPGGGCVIAVIGIDGSGKSTVAASIREWLGSEVDVMPIYFGTGDGRPSLFLLPLKMLVQMVAPVFKVKPRGASHGRISNRPPGILYSLLLMVWALAAALEKRSKLRAAHRGADRGVVVITDRYPQNEDASYNDGPLLPRLTYAPRRLRRLEADFYALGTRLRPDLVLRLEVSPETAARREPEMDEAVIRQRIETGRRLTFAGAHLVQVDAERPLAEVLRVAKHEIWALL